MAVDTIDFSARFYSAFGVVPVLTSNDRTIPGSQYLPILSQVKTYADTPSAFEDTEFIIGDEVLYFAGGPLTKSGEGGNVFAPPLIWVPRKAKQVIITNLDNGATTADEMEKTGSEVIERWGDSEWDISIQGLLVNSSQRIFPLAKLERLRKFFEIPQPVEVSGQIWAAMGINTIWFSEFIPSGVPGFQDTVSFMLQARSIKPVEFFLNGEEATV